MNKMKNLFKAIGRKTYFTFKRFARVMKSLNIFTFGAVFLAGTLMPAPVMATGDFVRVLVTPSSSTINLDESKSFSVVTKLNGTVVDADSIDWLVNGNHAQSEGTSFLFVPTAIGDYSIRANVVKNDIPQSSTATVKVKDVDDTNDDNEDNIFIRAVVTPSSSTITEGESKTFSVIVKKNGNITNADTIDWFVNGSIKNDFHNMPNMPLSPDVGTYKIAVKVVKDTQPAEMTYATLKVIAGNDDPDPASNFLRAVITPSSSTITEDETKRFNLITKLNGFTTLPNTITWLVDGVEQTGFSNRSYLILSSLNAGTYRIKVIVTKTGAENAQFYATLIVKEGTTPPPVEDFVRAVITPSSSTVSFGTNKTFNLVTKLNGFNYLADSIEWYVDGFHQTQDDNRTYIILNLPVGSHSINAQAWINGVMDEDTATLIVKDVTIVTDDYIRVEIIPSTQSIFEYEETTYTAIVRDEQGNNVTSTTSLDWSILDGNAVIVYGNHDTLRVRALGNIGSFNNIYVFATRVGGTNPDVDTHNDRAVLNVMDRTTPPPPPVCDDYYLNATIHGVIEDGSSPTAGDIILYTVKVNNYRPCTLTNVNVKVGVPVHTAFVSASSIYGNAPVLSGNNIYWTAGTLFSGQEKVMNFRVRIYDNVPTNGWYITAYGSATASEIGTFNIQSNQIFVPGGITPPPLPPTGIDWMVLLLIIMASLGMATLTYAWMYSREKRYEARF